MKKIYLIILLSFVLSFGSNAQAEDKQVKDCFEKVNRFTFAINQGLDKAIFKP